MAASISEGICTDHSLRAVRSSAGFGASPTDAEIMEAMRLLASVGLAAESSSCVPLAAARRLVAEGRIAGDAVMVLILTSSGIKWPQQLSALAPPVAAIRPEPDALDELLRQVMT